MLFYRAALSLSRQTLALCERVIRRHRGHIVKAIHVVQISEIGG